MWFGCAGGHGRSVVEQGTSKGRGSMPQMQAELPMRGEETHRQVGYSLPSLLLCNVVVLKVPRCWLRWKQHCLKWSTEGRPVKHAQMLYSDYASLRTETRAALGGIGVTACPGLPKLSGLL